MSRNQRSSQLVAFTELAILFSSQYYVAIITILWFQSIEAQEMGSMKILVPLVLANAGSALIQLVLIMLLLRGAEKKDLHYCRIWYYTNLVMFCVFVPGLFFSVILFPKLLSQLIEVSSVYIVYRTVSLKILKDFLKEITEKSIQKHYPLVT